MMGILGLPLTLSIAACGCPLIKACAATPAAWRLVPREQLGRRSPARIMPPVGEEMGKLIVGAIGAVLWAAVIAAR